MAKIKWVLMNVDNTQINTKQNKVIENSEMRRTINYLLDNDVNFTLVSRFHSNLIAKYTKEILIPNKYTYLISSYGTEVFSFKKKKVVNRFLIENKFLKEAEKIIKRIDFDFCQKVFIEINEKNGYVLLWNNNYKFFKNKVEEFQKNNNGVAYEVIDKFSKNDSILNIVITFLSDVNLKELIILLTSLNDNLSYKIVDKTKIVITAKEAGVGICMDWINNKYLRHDKDSIMTFSDSIIDMPLFKKSSVSITVDGALDDLKKTATNVFVGVEDMYINEFLKKEI